MLREKGYSGSCYNSKKDNFKPEVIQSELFLYQAKGIDFGLVTNVYLRGNYKWLSAHTSQYLP